MHKVNATNVMPVTDRVHYILLLSVLHPEHNSIKPDVTLPAALVK
jgi:hypothetical protein